MLRNLFWRVSHNVTLGGRITNTIYERMGIRMPQYHNPRTAYFYVEVRPVSCLRRIFKFWPYFVGNCVKNQIRIRSIGEGHALHIFEVFNGEEKRIRSFVSLEANRMIGNWKNIDVNPIDREGDVIYKIGISGNSSVAKTFFSTRVINTDRWLPGCIGFVFGIISGIIIWVISALINIRPFWEMWIPDWVLKWFIR